MKERIKEYLSTINLNDYDLGGCEIVDEDIDAIASKMCNGKDSIENVVEEYLCEIRKILDN